MKPSSRTLVLGAAGFLVAAGLVWWLLRPAPPASAPVAGTPPITVPAAPDATQAPASAPAPSAPVAAHRGEVAPAAASAPVEVATAPSAQPAPVPVAPSAIVAQPQPVIDEVVATERMYLAHAPLREPEVSDPDSETNRRILETMVTKALAASGSSAPAAN